MDTASNAHSSDPLQLPQATDDNGNRDLALTLSTRAALAINRLARHHQIDPRDVIERLVLAADHQISEGIDLDSAQWDQYFGLRRVTL